MYELAQFHVRRFMKPDYSFLRQLENLKQESEVIATYVYAEMSIQHAASKSRKLLSRMNMTPTFWNACYAAFQSAAYIAIGRVFDLKSPYNLEALLTSMERGSFTCFSGPPWRNESETASAATYLG